MVCCPKRRQSKTIRKGPRRVGSSRTSVRSYATQEQAHLGPAGQWGAEEGDVVRWTNQNGILFDLFLHLITRVPGRASRLCPCVTQSLLLAARNIPYSAMVSRFLAFTQTMTLTSTLGYLTSCPPPMFKKRKNLPSSSCLGIPGVTSRLLPNFPPEPGTSSAFLCNLQTVC